MKDVRHSTCALDCPDSCSLLVTVEDGRATSLRGNPEHPVTRGFLCGKVARYLEREYHPERLLHPMRRTGAKGAGQFARITWDEALDEIVTRLRALAAQYGPRVDPAVQLRRDHGVPERRRHGPPVLFTAWARRGWTAPSARRPVARG